MHITELVGCWHFKVNEKKTAWICQELPCVQHSISHLFEVIAWECTQHTYSFIHFDLYFVICSEEGRKESIFRLWHSETKNHIASYEVSAFTNVQMNILELRATNWNSNYLLVCNWWSEWHHPQNMMGNPIRLDKKK